MDAKVAAVPASADPVIGIMDQRLETDAVGKKVLVGELVNQSGQTVNIAHVLATYYDNTGKVIWVSDGYVDRALLPMAPQPFAVDLPADVATRIQRFRVMANQYTRGAS
jgi:phosphoserine phosphatase